VTTSPEQADRSEKAAMKDLLDTLNMKPPAEELNQRHVILSKGAIVKRLTDTLQKQKRGNPVVLARSRPEAHVHRRTLLRMMRGSPLRAAWAIGSPIALGVIQWMILVFIFLIPTAVNPANEISLPNGGAIIAGLIAAIVTIFMTHISMTGNFTDRDTAAVEAYALEAPHVVLALLQSGRSATELESDVSFVNALSQDRRKETADIRRRTVSTICAIGQAYDKARADLGTADATRVDADAASAVMTTIASARRDVSGMEMEIRERDATVALPVAEEFSVRMAQLASGTAAVTGGPKPAVIGNAVASRIVENARKALEIDPDMTDDAGARVDALVDEHLPSLLKRHADAARHARVEDLLSINADLENGIELIRRSVEEGLSRIRTTKAEALRTEIAFLKSRRGENDPRLSAIPEGNRHVG